MPPLRHARGRCPLCTLRPRGTVRFPVFRLEGIVLFYRARLFIDFWNFTLAWNDRVSDNCDWTKLPAAVVSSCATVFERLGIRDPVQLEETHVYASIDPARDAKLKQWLSNWLNRQPSFRVTVRERRARMFSVHCPTCGHDTTRCANCAESFKRAPEKGVDAAIVTDLLSLAWQGAYEVAVLVTSDADFIPAVDHVQEKGLKVINAGWRNHGHNLKKACWADLELDQIAPSILR